MGKGSRRERDGPSPILPCPSATSREFSFHTRPAGRFDRQLSAVERHGKVSASATEARYSIWPSTESRPRPIVITET